MANYEAPLLQATSATTYKTTGVLAANGRRSMVYEVEFGQTGGLSSSDCQCEWDLSRISNTNTLAATVFTLNLLDGGDVAASTIFYNNATTEPPNITTQGLGLNLKHWGINQRGSYRWRALDDNDNIIIASGASQGIAVRLQSISFTGSAIGNISIVER